MDENPQDANSQAQNQSGAEDSSVLPSPGSEQQTSSDEQDTNGADQQDSGTEEQPSEEEHKPSRAERRIQQLSRKVREAEQRNQLPPAFNQPQVPVLQPGQEIQPEEYQQHVVQAAQAISSLQVNSAIAQERAINNVERDTELLPTKYAELNESDPAYSPELEKAIAEEFQERAFRVVGYDQQGQPITQLDPSVRLADIAKRSVETVRAVVNKSSANMRNAVAKTADATGLKPQGAVKSDKPFAELSIKEMEAQLGFAKR